MDWLSGLFEMTPVSGRLDLRCSYGAPWRIDQGPGEANEIPYHAVVGGSAVLEDPAGGKPLRLESGDILLLPGNPHHVMTAAAPGRSRREIAKCSISSSARTPAGASDWTFCADISRSRRRTTAWCAAICRLV